MAFAPSLLHASPSQPSYSDQVNEVANSKVSKFDRLTNALVACPRTPSGVYPLLSDSTLLHLCHRPSSMNELELIYRYPLSFINKHR